MIIYLITNLINNKKYVGKTTNFIRRYQQHFSKNNINKEPTKVLYQAMHKYGFDNFQMAIIEECNDEVWEEREQYWIEYYHSMVPNGYNMIPGGSEPPHLFGDLSAHHVLDQVTADKIIKLLLKYSPKELSNKEIAIQFNISRDQIVRINNGTIWTRDDITYPIRQYNKKQDLDEIYALLESWEYTCEEIAEMFNCTKSCIKAINNGQNFFDPDRVYPIKPPKIFYPKTTFYWAKELIEQGLNNNQIIKITGMKIGTLNNLRNGKYDKYLTCND